jgi:hypothetical protein
MVAVEWRIKKGQEEEFLEYWSTRSTGGDASFSPQSAGGSATRRCSKRTTPRSNRYSLAVRPV